MGTLKFDENNSGGGWWLTTAHYKALEQAGWIVHWYHSVDTDHGEYEGKGTDEDPHSDQVKNGKYKSLLRDHSHKYYSLVEQLPAESDGSEYIGGAHATSAVRVGVSKHEGLDEWQAATGYSGSEEGCNCCGHPFNFTFTTDGGQTEYMSLVTESYMDWN